VKASGGDFAQCSDQMMADNIRIDLVDVKAGVLYERYADGKLVSILDLVMCVA